jgi:hypothetical protein
VQVVVALARVVGKDAEGGLWTAATAGGLLAGLLIMYGTGLLVAG